jgi:hypothetical protein
MKTLNITLEREIFRITRRATLQYNDSNPGFVSFKNMNHSAARSSVKKLIDAGFLASVSSFDKELIIVNLSPAKDVQIKIARNGQEIAKEALLRLDSITANDRNILKKLTFLNI